MSGSRELDFEAGPEVIKINYIFLIQKETLRLKTEIQY